MTKPKNLSALYEFASIFRQPKWLCVIELHGFSCRKEKANIRLMKKLQKIVAEYNNSKC